MPKEDSFIGCTFPTPKGGILSVVGLNTGRNKNYLFSCSICSTDSELFPSGTFAARKEHIHRGVIPCGCSRAPRMDERQAVVIINRSESCRSYKYIRMAGEYTGVHTKVVMHCDTHGEWSSSTVERVLNGVVCPKCKISIIGSKLKTTNLLPDKFMIDKFICSGSYPSGSLFKRASKSEYWSFRCPICAEDEFCNAGLCDGWFESQAGALKRGQKPCRCSNNFKWNQAQRELQIISECELRGLDFIGWNTEEGYKTSQSKIIASCNLHGRFSSSVANFIYRGTSCPGCASGGYDQTKTGYIYTLISECHAFIKVGISNSPQRRHKELSRSTPFAFSDVTVYEMDGRKANDLETETLKLFESAGLSGFHGATEWLRYDPAIIEYIQQRA